MSPFSAAPMKTLSPPLRLAELQPGDRFHFAAEVLLKNSFPMIAEWESHGPLRPGVSAISLVDQAVPHAERLRTESADDVRVVRIVDNAPTGQAAAAVA